MDSSKIFFIIFAIFAASVPLILASEHTVGDDQGWGPNFRLGSSKGFPGWRPTWHGLTAFVLFPNELSQAQGVNRLTKFNLLGAVFKYQEGAHNVLRVDGTAFQQCAAAAGTQALTSGNDVINLTTPGQNWYICGIGTQCAFGDMKLAITVLAEGEPPVQTHQLQEQMLHLHTTAGLCLFLALLGWL